jgi:hypothetical protein
MARSSLTGETIIQPDLVTRIRALLDGGLTQKAAAERLGVSPSTVSRVLAEQRRADVPCRPAQDAVDRFVASLGTGLAPDVAARVEALRSIARKLDWTGVATTGTAAMAASSLAKEFRNLLDELRQAASFDELKQALLAGADTDVVCEPRFATARTLERKTLGGAAAKIAKVLRQELMGWQRHVLDVALEVDADGRLVYGDVALSVPRQQGKSFLVLVLMLTRALLAPRQTVVYAAQTGLDARKKWADDWTPLLDASPLGSQVTAYRAPGRESWRFPNGSVQQLVASTAKAGHGMVLDLAILDEAFAYQDARTEQALRPAMMTGPNSQLWVVSTAGTPHGSPYLLERVERGRQAVEAGLTRGLAFFEWAAADGADPGDTDTWRSCMPALGRTVTEEAVDAAFRSMSRHEFERAYLNRWTTSMGEPAIDLEAWDALAEPDVSRPESVVLGVDVAPGSKSAAIAAAGERGGVLYVSSLEHGPGTEWLPGRLGALVSEFGVQEVVVDRKAAGALLGGFTDAQLTEVSATDMANGCAFLVDLVRNRNIRHRGEHELRVAIDGAAKRPLGDAFGWSRKNSGVDITPLVAVTLAAWASMAGWGVRWDA